MNTAGPPNSSSEGNAKSSNTRPNIPLHELRFKANQQAYQEYLPLAEILQQDLRQDAEQLQSQEGWDLATQQGVANWVEDRDSVFRFIKRNGYNEEKAYAALLSALSNRVTKSLHTPIPSIPPYSTSPLFHILPPSRYYDRLGRPIAVISTKEIRRDDQGTLEDLQQWVWWSSEMLRRTLRDYWVKKRWCAKDIQGCGGEGCVTIVNAAGAGYRNLEVELLPTLARVGSKNFPGMVEAAYVVNAGWTQKSLWNIVKKILPKTALERIRFIDQPSQLEEIFDLDRLPKAFGGRDDYTFNAQNNPVLDYYQSHSIGAAAETTGPRPRSASFASTAEVFYSVEVTPAVSPRSSRHGSVTEPTDRLVASENLRMTKSASPQVISPSSAEQPYPSHISPEAESQLGDSYVDASMDLPDSVDSSHTSSSNLTAMERIRSLVDFKLYLSSSRLAQVELLDDTDDEGDFDPSSSPPPPPPESSPKPHRVLRPAMFETGIPPRAESVATRRARPSLRLLGIPTHVSSTDPVRTYSDQLLRHHAKGLQSLDTQAVVMPQPVPARDDDSLEDNQGETGASSVEPSPPPGSADSFDTPPAATTQVISAFSRSSNPWYGYPAVRVPDDDHPGSMAIRPRYTRNRKRDLVKTLIFLFLLRLQSWRDAIERSLGLNRLVPWVGSTSNRSEARDPKEGLLRTAEEKQKTGSGKTGVVVRSKKWEADWLWMIVGFMLMRGTWTRLIAAPLEALGFVALRDILGLN